MSTRFYKIILLFFIFSYFPCTCSILEEKGKYHFQNRTQTSFNIQGYAYNPLVPLDVWSLVQPYFLPCDHPAKAKLDSCFMKERVTLNPESFAKAGFGDYERKNPYNIIFGKAYRIPGIIIKVYLDSQPPVEEWLNWIKRIKGSEVVRECIERNQFKHFTVPHKWIYPLPASPSPPDDPIYTRKNFILVAEDMQILKKKKNKEAFKNNMNYEMLDELYVLLTEAGLYDSLYKDNIPFTKSGKLAVVDTEHFSNWPIYYSKLTHCFSKKNQAYWTALIDQGGP